MAEPAGPLPLCGGDRCFILEFGVMVQRNNKHSGKRYFGEMQKAIQRQILVNSDVESNIN